MHIKLIEQHLQSVLDEPLPSEAVSLGMKDYHYQSNLPLKFKYKKDPLEFGAEIAQKLKDKYPDYYTDITITNPGFINFNVNLGHPYQQTKAIAPAIKPATVVVDYGGVNIAKKMHIGHIRSLFIGDYLVRLHESLGFSTVLYNHIGDMGNQFGYVIEYIKQNNVDLNKGFDNQKLTEIYKEAYALYKNDPEFLKKADRRASLFQKNDPETIQIWETIKEISMNENYNFYKKLGVKLEKAHTYGESFYLKMGAGIVQDLLAQNLAERDVDGSVVVKFPNDLPPLVLQKSNGNFLYPVYDLAAVKYRVETHNPWRILYVVDQRQSVHFQQIFWLAQQAGYSKTTELIHINFGYILDKNQKPIKTRSGDSLYLDELFQEGLSILEKDERYKLLPPVIKDEILQKTIGGGLKFYDLRFNRNQNYVFDWKDVLNFQGTSAPYLQNVLVRVDSLFYKYQTEMGLSHETVQKVDFKPEYLKSVDHSAGKILLLAQEINSIFEENVKSYQSSKIIDYLMKIGKQFHAFYEKTSILNQEDTQAKLWLCQEASNALKHGLDILGIPYYDCVDRLKNKYQINEPVQQKSLKP